MSESTQQTYAELGFGHRQGIGRRPALVVVDFCHGFTDPASPLACGCDDALVATARLLEAFRARGLAIAYTTVIIDERTEKIAAAFIAKAPALRALRPGTRWVEIDERIAPADDEPIIDKVFASAFFGTALSSMLTAAGSDSVVVVGASTSGCVRATAVDALQHGYRVVVPRDAVADRAPGPHDAALADIDAKYGDVMDADEVIAQLPPVTA
jgi:nicotinamidase-related amidase